MAAPAYASVGTETQTTSSLTSTANIPTVANGDLLIMAVSLKQTPSAMTTPSGWTKIVDTAGWGTGSATTTYVFWRIASGEPSSYSLACTGATATWHVNVFALTGAHTSTPIDQVATLVTPGTATTIVCPTVTTTGPDRLICGITFQPRAANVTPPGALTERYDRVFATGAMGQALGTATQATAAATGTFTWTQPSESRPSLGVTIAISPAASVITPVANFTATPLTGTWPLSVAFTDTSTNVPTSWAWTFGDGGTSTSQNPSHSYTAAGTYTVALTATNAIGADTETKTGYVTVANPSGTLTKIKWGDGLVVTDEGAGVIRADVDADAVAAPDATTATTGLIQLAGDLTGTATSPQIAAGAIVNADINNSAAIAETKLNLATDAAAGTGSRRTLGTGALQAAAGNDTRFDRPALVTSLPGSPVNGQEIYYVADATNGLIWHLRYRTASPSSYKWEFLGGSEIVEAIAAGTGNISSSAWADGGTLGPDLTVPIAGDYDLTKTITAWPDSDATPNSVLANVGVGTGWTTPLTNSFDIGVYLASAHTLYGMTRVDRVTLTAGALLRMRYQNSSGAGNANFMARTIRLRPVRVG